MLNLDELARDAIAKPVAHRPPLDPWSNATSGGTADKPSYASPLP